MNKFSTKSGLKALLKGTAVLGLFLGLATTAPAQTAPKMDMTKHIPHGDDYSGGVPKNSAGTVIANGATVVKFDSSAVLNWDAKTMDKYGAREIAEAQPVAVSTYVAPQTIQSSSVADLKAKMAAAQKRYNDAKVAKKAASKSKDKAAKKQAEADMKSAKAEMTDLKKQIRIASKASGKSAAKPVRVKHTTVKTSAGGAAKSSSGTSTK